MAASDFLKNFRQKGYAGNMSEKPLDEKDGMDSSDKNSTTRIVTLNDDEQKMFEKANPGDDIACEVHGTYENGKLNIMSVSPMGGGAPEEDEEKSMAGQVAQRVMPGMPM